MLIETDDDIYITLLGVQMLDRIVCFLLVVLWDGQY